MMRLDEIPKIVLVAGATDLRKGIDGYATIIQDQTEFSPFEAALYLFCNRDHNKLKCLYWDRTGFWLLYKRLEKGHFQWKRKDGAAIISHQQLQWLLQGLKIDQKTALKPSHPTYV